MVKKRDDRNTHLNKEKGDWIIEAFIYLILVIFCFVCLYPFWYIVIASFNEGHDMMKGGVYWWPRKPTLYNYVTFFGEVSWMNALKVSVLRTVIGGAVTTLFTCLVAYALSRKDLIFGNTYRKMFVFSMYVSGGLIPFYFILRLLGLVNTFWVYIIPGLLNLYFVMVGINFFRSIPDALVESAYIDGASEIRIYLQIVLPLSLPFIATLALFSAVGQWNSWIDSVYYVSDKSLRPMAYQMVTLLNRTQGSSSTSDITSAIQMTTLTSQATAVVITIAPILMLYPLLQKYFVQGIMIGSVKE
ncbi:MAG: carbohydrate ABC transporter permease [Clostridiaceae bacterium]|nr:carbohydrate ABC transporter permease [Clostridiaceae bacterium]